MPRDSLYLNNKATQQNTYHTIVVGSGLSGGWAAKELCEKRLKALVLEGGRQMQHPTYPTATKNLWDFTHRGPLTLADKESHYVQSRHYSYQEENKHFYSNNRENPYTEVKRFDRKTSVLNAFNHMYEVANVFISDGSCMTSGSRVNPSITYMALTARACDYAVRELKKGNI